MEQIFEENPVAGLDGFPAKAAVGRYLADGYAESQKGLNVGDHQIRFSGAGTDPEQRFHLVTAAVAVHPTCFKMNAYRFRASNGASLTIRPALS